MKPDVLVAFKIPFFSEACQLNIFETVVSNLLRLGFVELEGSNENMYMYSGKSFEFFICFLGNKNLFQIRYHRFL